MRRVVSLIVLLASICSISLANINPAWAANLANGAAVFSANCAACHMGGKNVVNAAKTLQKEDLQKYDMYDIDKIKYQIIHGKAAMPAFGGRLTAEQIEDVAAYVLAQADKGWK
ncbi:MAG: c-type cytochrome [Geminocystis sp.]|nr:c-type cytochrome [Geminocystis sp.]HIK37559.1 c-type cytochrome [Geminocystis sp. M7585_C2015_104]MCS7146713.1 c-type cytochrome [Geminocystis sp.]MCX8077137.1 c-type cytochrome [Geminocystis sp.]MDW8115539.1 c-type cytochrome [Geminocystis sp.]